MKDHEIAQLVNELTDIAKKYHGYDCLREKISKAIVPTLKLNQSEKAFELTESEACELNISLNVDD